jgi:hypothetical protein
MTTGTHHQLYRLCDNEAQVTDEWALKEFRDRLIAVGAKDAAQDTMEFLGHFRNWRYEHRSTVARLAPVWRAIEWQAAGIGSEARLEEALAEHRRIRSL